jgi:hypothetical protein
MLIIILVFVVIYAAYSARSLTHRIYCSFRRRDNTVIYKWAKEDQSRIDFDGGWYDVEPSSIVQRLWDGGIHWVFPTWIRCLDFRFDSPRPLNPRTFNNQYNPQERKQLDKTDDIRAYHKGSQQALQGKAGKQGFFERWLPIIVLIGFLAVGWMIHQQNTKLDMIGNGQNVIEQQMGELQNRINQGQ